MDGKRTTNQTVHEVIESASTIDTVNTPPFFKDKVLQRLTQNNEVVKGSNILGWFTPNFQIAALFLFVILNVTAIYSYYNSNQQQELEAFAEAYGLSSSSSSSSSESILN